LPGEHPTSCRRRSRGAAGCTTSSSGRRAVRHGHDDRRRLEPPGPLPEFRTPPPAWDLQRNPPSLRERGLPPPRLEPAAATAGEVSKGGGLAALGFRPRPPRAGRHGGWEGCDR
jgi:hypothetical protein